MISNHIIIIGTLRRDRAPKDVTRIPVLDYYIYHTCPAAATKRQASAHHLRCVYSADRRPRPQREASATTFRRRWALTISLRRRAAAPSGWHS